MKVEKSLYTFYMVLSQQLLPDDEEIPETNQKYSFTSYADSQGNEQLATGTVEIIGTEGDYSKAKVLTNSVDGFVGNVYYIVSNAQTDGTLYQLYTDAGTTGTGMYVSIQEI